MLITLAWTGMRRGELLALHWDDYQDGEIFVQRSICAVEKMEKVTKTDDPRLVWVARPLVEVLEEQRSWLLRSQHPGLSSGLVFPASPRHAKGGMTRRDLKEVSWYRALSVLDKPLRQVCAKADVPRITNHSFRRTYENLLRQTGAQDLVRRSMAGWRTEEAQAIYAGVARSERAETTEAMVRLVETASPDAVASPACVTRLLTETTADGLEAVNRRSY